MCIIMDGNRLNVFLKQPQNKDMVPLHKWLAETGRIVYSTGDKFSRELKKFARKRLVELDRMGKAKSIPDEVVSKEAEQLRSSKLDIKSDDHHVLALARLSNVRLLVAGDHKLHTDFKNTNIVPSPKGHIYQGKQHQNLLKNTVCR